MPALSRRDWCRYAALGTPLLGSPSLLGADATRPVKVSLLDPTGEAPRPGCIRVRRPGSKWLVLNPLLNRCAGLRSSARELGWHVLTGHDELVLPLGLLEYEAFADINSELLRGEIDSSKQNQLRLAPTNLFDPADTSQVAGNTHVHLRKMTRPEVNRYLTEIPRADGLKVVFVSYLERALASKTYITNQYSKEDLSALTQKGLTFGDGEEYRHNFGGGGEGYGHVMLLNLAKRILPASVGPGITLEGNDKTPLHPGIRLAKEGGSTVIWCHNTFGYEDIPNFLNGNVHAQNIFDGGNRGSYADAYYRYLNIGMNVPFATGTDWFIYDFSRTYVRMNPDEPSTPEGWLKRLRNSASTITNGTWLDLSVNAANPGDTLVCSKPRKLRITAKATGRNDFGRTELIRNGEVIAGANSEKFARGYRVEFSFNEHTCKEPEWWALRIAHPNSGRNELEQPLFAHTSPIYIDYDNKRVFDSKTAQSLIDELDESVKRIRRFGKFANEDEQNGVLKFYRAAREKLAAKLR
ncbi:MAG: CehA/McbA family metallohydrolase [Limisphaerales bacterium]